MLIAFSLTLSTLLPLAASAGTYTWQTTDASGKVTAQSPTFSGGVVNVVTSVHAPGKSNTFPPTPFSTSSGHYTGSGNCESNSTIVTNTPASVKVNSPAKPIVATFTWQATSSTDLPPPAVIVQQNCTASWTGGSYLGTGTATGSADCGLPNATNTPTVNSSGITTGLTSSGVQYSVVPSPGASFSVPVSGSYQPTASTSATSGTSGDGSSSASVDYQVQAFPVFIVPGGAIKDSSGNYNILIGQGCTASLSGIPAALLNNTANPPTYQWNVSGTTFQDWESTTPAFPNASPPTQANSNASYYDPGPGVQTNPTYHWYWNDPAQTTETVTCMATVTPPTGQGSAFSVTATQKVVVYVPTRSTNTNTIGDGRVINSAIIATPTPTMKNNLQSFGSSWTTAISMPPTPVFGAGQWCYCQLITPGEYATTGGIQYETTETKAGDGLDANFPYQNSAQDSGIEPADGNTYHSGDSPRLSDLPSAASSVKLTDSLHTYVMFKPPGNDSKWVSLSESRWDTNFNASQPNAGWSAFSPSQSVGPINLVYTFVSENNPPMWTQIVQSGQNLTFVPVN